MTRIVMSGYLNYNSAGDGWNDSINLRDGVDTVNGGVMGCEPLGMDSLKLFHGREVYLMVELKDKQ